VALESHPNLINGIILHLLVSQWELHGFVTGLALEVYGVEDVIWVVISVDTVESEVFFAILWVKAHSGFSLEVPLGNLDVQLLH